MDRQEEKIEIVVNTRKTKNVKFYIYADDCRVNWGDGTSDFYNESALKTGDEDSIRAPKKPRCEHTYRGINHVVTIVISGSAIVEFKIEHTPLTAIRCDNCYNLASIICPNCSLRQLHTGNTPNLLFINCICNNLHKLDLSRCPSLLIIECDCNYLSELNLSYCRRVSNIICRFNQLKKLRIADYPDTLHTVKCGYNNLPAKELNRLFQNLALFFDRGHIDYSFNPGTLFADSSSLIAHDWTILNATTEKKVERILEDLNAAKDVLRTLLS